MTEKELERIFSGLSESQLMAHFNLSSQGLTEKQRAERKDRHRVRHDAIKSIRRSFLNPFSLTLSAIATVSIMTALLLPEFFEQ